MRDILKMFLNLSLFSIVLLQFLIINARFDAIPLLEMLVIYGIYFDILNHQGHWRTEEKVADMINCQRFS